MANNEHPITPPPELVASLRNSAPHGIRDAGVTRELWLINKAYAAGAHRRPKPLSQAEQAIVELDEAVIRGDCITTSDAMPSLRAAELLQCQQPQPEPVSERLPGAVEQALIKAECLKRLCDDLAAAVKPNGGYRVLTTNDDISDEFIGEQLVGVEWWLPQHGCDSLENTLDSIKGRILAAARDWAVRTLIALPAPAAPMPLSLKEQALELIDDCTDPEGDYLDDNALSIIRRALEALPE